ncbi:hypothetical protein MUK42_08536 [Musa troglodytarum]|uniref:Uncharacterized protein n=1 Tax=Musa troglodytarum TaxID=320322 RepID=A0A9E7EB56_9LILI|nr:hypothetical protein MUK42_08536 [Musa troglodytarum]URD73700.1 hypothetical protein MUK42_08536 [Musa troglodytarum]URD73701.1 hypothetical protein MUK42_08536 [Musa troglodytarum]URD73702.1 hypothetical protein MUK42_08536 [Musa troglodytarum]URD73703.1 hypothetical protein MUK42_08536 [Musa troglodytarum]
MNSFMLRWMSIRLASRRLFKRCLECPRWLRRGLRKLKKSKVLCRFRQPWPRRVRETMVLLFSCTIYMLVIYCRVCWYELAVDFLFSVCLGLCCL